MNFSHLAPNCPLWVTAPFLPVVPIHIRNILFPTAFSTIRINNLQLKPSCVRVSEVRRIPKFTFLTCYEHFIGTVSLKFVQFFTQVRSFSVYHVCAYWLHGSMTIVCCGVFHSLFRSSYVNYWFKNADIIPSVFNLRFIPTWNNVWVMNCGDLISCLPSFGEKKLLD